MADVAFLHQQYAKVQLLRQRLVETPRSTANNIKRAGMTAQILVAEKHIQNWHAYYMEEVVCYRPGLNDPTTLCGKNAGKCTVMQRNVTCSSCLALYFPTLNSDGKKPETPKKPEIPITEISFQELMRRIDEAD